MDEARRVIERLERIERLDRAAAPAGALLDELRGLLADAEAWARLEGGEAGADAVALLRGALASESVAV